MSKKLSITLATLFFSCTLLFAQKEIRQTVHYDFGSAALTKPEKQKLDSLVNALKAYDNFVIHLKGHTDAIGSEHNNGDLSTQRCYSIRTYLISKNVPANTITIESFGESKPASTNDSPEGRAQNRRVDIVVNLTLPVPVPASIAEVDNLNGNSSSNDSGEPQTITLPLSGSASAGGYGFNIVTNTAQMQAMNLTTQTVEGQPLMSNSMFCITSTPTDTTNPLPVVVLIPATANPFCKFPDVEYFDSQVDSTDNNQVKWMPLSFPDLKPVTINGVNYFEWTIPPRTPRGRCKNADCRSGAPARSANIILNSKKLEIVSLSVIYPDANALLRGKVVEKNRWEFKYFGNDSLSSPLIKVVVKDKNGQLRTAEVFMRDLKLNKKGEYILKKKMFVKRES